VRRVARCHSPGTGRIVEDVEAWEAGVVVRRRSAVVVVEDGCVVLIRRRREGRTYHLFPGGGVEPGETDQRAAEREAHEELGVRVRLGRLLGTVRFEASEQVYFEATIADGTVGTGTGSEMCSREDSAAGSYQPVWMPLGELGAVDVRPAALGDMLSSGSLPRAPFSIRET
jgi:8-oxo-dGTP diphosphatase